MPMLPLWTFVSDMPLAGIGWIFAAFICVRLQRWSRGLKWPTHRADAAEASVRFGQEWTEVLTGRPEPTAH